MKSFSARVIAECTVNIPRPVEDLYLFWMNFENLTEVFTRIARIKVLSPLRSRWYAVVSDETALEWETEIVTERLNQAIDWQSVPGSHLLQEGSVRFKAIGKNTRLTLSLRYGATGLALTDVLGKVFGSNPGLELEHDLKRFQTRLAMPAGPDRGPPFPFPAGLPPILK